MINCHFYLRCSPNGRLLCVPLLCVCVCLSLDSLVTFCKIKDQTNCEISKLTLIAFESHPFEPLWKRVNDHQLIWHRPNILHSFVVRARNRLLHCWSSKKNDVLKVSRRMNRSLHDIELKKKTTVENVYEIPNKWGERAVQVASHHKYDYSFMFHFFEINPTKKWRRKKEK